MEYPLNMIVTKVLLIFLGEYSVISATTLGITPPIPSPARKRRIPNCNGVSANPLINVNPLNKKIQMIIVFFRPIRSESVPKINAPNIIPKSA
ncbi:hypothetical protein D3C86_1524360 [compost metagenome]